MKIPATAVLCSLWLVSPLGAQSADGTPSVLHVVPGVSRAGYATDLWLAMLRNRLSQAAYDTIDSLRKPLTPEEQAGAELIQSRSILWEREIPGLAELFRPIGPPGDVNIVIGNRGAEDAFTHDPGTIGFDLAALQANYGDARLAVNTDRVDRFFRHEFVHLLQKAWLPMNPWKMDTPLRTALAEIWAEGLGNYYSLSARWRTRDGTRSEAAASALRLWSPASWHALPPSVVPRPTRPRS